MFEQEELEKNNILNSMENLTKSIKKKDKLMFLEELSGLFQEKTNFIKEIPFLSKGMNLRKISYDTMDSSEYEEKILNNINSSWYQCQSLSSRESNSTNFNSLGSLISQNLEIFHRTLKIMVLGDKNVGKTTLVNKIIGRDNISVLGPTKSLIFILIFQSRNKKTFSYCYGKYC